MDKINHQTVQTNGINLHVATIGDEGAQPIIFIHGFPELWYCWRHQMVSLSSLGYRAIAPDLPGYGDSDAPKSADQYNVLRIVGCLIGLLDALRLDKVFVVAHDWGAVIAWHFCLFRPDRVKALVNTSVAFLPRHPERKPVQSLRAFFGDDYYICKFQEPGEIEQEFERVGTERVIKIFLTGCLPRPPRIPKTGFCVPADDPLPLPSWLTEEDVKYYVTKFDKSGFTGGLNYYRCLDLNWELTAPWIGAQIKVPVKFIIGDLDITYHMPGVKEYIHGEGFKRDVPLLQEVVVMEGVDHFLNQEKPEEISNHIYDFIKKF